MVRDTVWLTGIMDLSTPARLKADIRLAQAVSQFEADLTTEQKAEFRTQRSLARDRPPGLGDVMHLTALIDQNASSQMSSRTRCVGPRLTNFLQSIQQYVALGDIVVGGAQNLVASGVWALVRSSFLVSIASDVKSKMLSSCSNNDGIVGCQQCFIP